MGIATISAEGTLTIPRVLREKYHLVSGTRVRFMESDTLLVLVPLPDDPVAALCGMLKDGPPLTTDLVVERALEKSRGR